VDDGEPKVGDLRVRPVADEDVDLTSDMSAGEEQIDTVSLAQLMSPCTTFSSCR
jgi:hypothetical protein